MPAGLLLMHDWVLIRNIALFANFGHRGRFVCVALVVVSTRWGSLAGFVGR